MRKCLLFFVLIISHMSLSAQNNCWDCDLDSLRKELPKKKTDADRLRLLMLIVDLQGVSINNYLIESFPDSRLRYVDELLQLNDRLKSFNPHPYRKLKEAIISYAENNYEAVLGSMKQAIELFDKEKKVIVVLLANIRNIYNLLERQEERFQFFNHKLEYYKTHGPLENTAPCFHSLAGYYNYKAEYNLSITHYLKAAEVYQNFYNRYYINELAAIGDTYVYWGNYDKAYQYLRIALPLTMAINNELNISLCLSALTKISLYKRKYEEALGYANQVIELWENRNDKAYSYAIALYHKALVYLEKTQPALALPILKKANSYSDSLPDKLTTLYGDLEVDYGYYLYYKLVNNREAAGSSLKKAFQLAVKDESDELQLKYLRELYHFHEQYDQAALAEQYANRYFSLKDAVEKKHNQYKVASYEYEQNDRVKSGKIQQLNQERAMQALKLTQKNKVIVISLIALALISLLLLFLYRQLKVNRRTLRKLRSTQAQLVQKEKMASLGELTAGIAHEIQNPLNFVNNFSDVSIELVDELKKEVQQGNRNEVMALAVDIEGNLKKVAHHGRRADSIVKSMMEHSRGSGTEKQLTDMNDLTEEYLKLAYNGYRAKDKSFNAVLETRYDPSAARVSVVPQEVGRVLLNLFNNAFYAVQEKKAKRNGTYEPCVQVSTRREGSHILISVSDNGTGMSPKVAEKVFQPFFTTKPSGEGTGLGLSLSYDIITKGHGGELSVQSTEGNGSEFVVTLPAS